MTLNEERLIAALQPFADYIPDNSPLPPDMPITAGSGLARRQLIAADCYRAKAAIEAVLRDAKAKG